MTKQVESAEVVLGHTGTHRRWNSFIGLAGISAAFVFGFVIPLPYRVATFHPWLTGDWIISYSGGFVRRGLFGSLLSLANLDAVQAIKTVALVQFFLAALLFFLVGLLFWRSSPSPAWIMLVLSPAFLLFPVLDPDASGRKELIGLVALAAVALGATMNRVPQTALLVLPLYTLGVFSHEVVIVMLPSFLFLILSSPQGKSQSSRMIACAYSIVGVLGAAAAFLAPANEQRADDLCALWLQSGGPGCDGALEFLSQSPGDARHYLITELFPHYWMYLPAGALALLPLFVTRFLPGKWRIAVVVVAASMPLFLVAWDYGRWIYVIVAQLSLLALALARQQQVQPMRVPLLAAVAFVVLWGMEHVGQAFSPGVLIRVMEPLLHTL